MRSRGAALLFAWWFFYPWYGGSMVGPFPDALTCMRIRAEVASKVVSSCWSDGR